VTAAAAIPHSDDGTRRIPELGVVARGVVVASSLVSIVRSITARYDEFRVRMVNRFTRARGIRLRCYGRRIEHEGAVKIRV